MENPLRSVMEAFIEFERALIRERKDEGVSHPLALLRRMTVDFETRRCQVELLDNTPAGKDLRDYDPPRCPPQHPLRPGRGVDAHEGHAVVSSTKPSGSPSPRTCTARSSPPRTSVDLRRACWNSVGPVG